MKLYIAAIYCPKRIIFLCFRVQNNKQDMNDIAYCVLNALPPEDLNESKAIKEE